MLSTDEDCFLNTYVGRIKAPRSQYSQGSIPRLRRTCLTFSIHTQNVQPTRVGSLPHDIVEKQVGISAYRCQTHSANIRLITSGQKSYVGVQRYNNFNLFEVLHIYLKKIL